MPGPRVSRGEVVEAGLTWTGARFEPGVRIAVDAGGRIEAVGALEREPTRRLPRRALVPGLVDAHSHAFQRGLRGRGETFPAGRGSFWTWREAMYGLVESLDRASFGALCRRTFGEMRDAGITTVGEFHYLHHATGSTDGSFDEVVLDAAAEVGIRLVLLQSYYRTGGIGRPLEAVQRRFDSGSLAGFLEGLDRLAGRLDPRTQALGIAPHSIRAATLDDIVALHAEAVRRRLPFHIHVEEQPAEIEECVDAHGERPLALLLRALGSAERLVAVHCTHTTPGDLAALVEAGGSACICPLTEANLGDGLPELAPLGGFIDRLSLGSDSNARIAMTEEMRWLEYGQRLARGERGALTDPGGSVGRALLAIATTGGAAALAVEAGAIAPGRWADFAAIDLDAPALAGCDEDSLLDGWIFGSGNGAIAATCVAGTWRASSGREAPGAGAA
ncbi:MAG TPA: formimidoylglutamate deiminase [Gemmatimonadota bacterium]|nr:formimidoylglutamate deiminase [Gemmatimonadota bacterium]